MAFVLTEIEIRVLGSLIEKQLATPEYYPLTLNALVAACNQKSSRDPVVNYNDTQVLAALDDLRDKNFVYIFYGSSSRTPKYKHMMREVFELSTPQVALMCVLMLRGAQTIGELRERTGRLYEFSGFDEVEEDLNALIASDIQPLVIRLPRQPGQKEARLAHLLAGEAAISAAIERSAALEQTAAHPAQSERLARIEAQVETLASELKSLKQMFEDFKKQFE
jgi:uncharacterized protein YceH (UPF0502 family)